MEIINWALIRHPVNWLTILLMIVIASFAIDAVLRWHAGNTAGGA